MNKFLICIYPILLLALTANTAIALRCGNDLIREGDTASEVRITLKNNGGEIIEKSYFTTKTKISKKSKKKKYTSHTVEKWFVKTPSGYGHPYCYELTFEGSVLEKIGHGVECE
ncbi:MAG: DUF2845 domain-containing protein [Proteobacteria bacterium]|nr:DUF2845 domain-containing protein [Pseudomonadota bacterium]